MRRQLRHARPATALLLTLGLGLGAAACGDDGGEAAQEEVTTDTTEAPDAGETPAPEPDVEPAARPEGFCEAVLAVAAAEAPAFDPEATPEETAEAEQAFIDDQIRPAIEELAATAPEEVAGDVETLAAAVDAAAGGEEVPDRMETLRAQSNIVSATVDNCEFASVEVTGTEYAFAGVPESVPAGVTVFRLTNEGEEIHEMVILRRNDGVEESFEEILELPDEEARQRATFITAASFTEQGGTTATLADLAPGEYGVLCSMSKGTTSLEEPTDPEQEPGAPHFTEGMVATFTVE
jgi:hypothetical protein